jgi:hypothetical protein
MATHLNETQVKSLLYELCVRLGFCLPKAEQKRLEREPPTEVEAFADAVYTAEGADPHAHLTFASRCAIVLPPTLRRRRPWNDA